MFVTGKVSGPVLPELLIMKAIDHGAQEARDDVDKQEEDVSNLQAQLREERDQSRLKGGNHKGEHAQQQLKQKQSVDKADLCLWTQIFSDICSFNCSGDVVKVTIGTKKDKEAKLASL